MHYYAGMRPAEVINLRKSHCRLPRSGWGLLNLKGGIVASGGEWSDDGTAFEAHSLKRRAARATRPMPIPSVLVRMLLDHVARFGVADDGRIFRNAAGNYIDCSAYNITWGRAREAVLTEDEHALKMAKRPYDLRHAGISFWLVRAWIQQNARAGLGRAFRSCSGTTRSSFPEHATMPISSSRAP
ncbi:hypothetical protein ACOB87_37215 [Streptomyces sp. YS-B37]|uniref:hypothetical protein n=1 Tax=Streptomyces sp. YS-B37 TaxID=3407669 RepID=UPI003B513D04